jgi:low temperature requirement protein LtrA
MVAGVVLIALGMKTTIAHVGDPLSPETAFALVGGLALYLLAHVAFRFRHIRSINQPRMGLSALLLLFLPVADQPPALVTVGLVTGAMVALVTFEATQWAEARDHIRHQ